MKRSTKKTSKKGKPVKKSTASAAPTRLHVPPALQNSKDVTILENEPVTKLKTGKETGVKRKRSEA